jgi:hypothetical protein
MSTSSAVGPAGLLVLPTTDGRQEGAHILNRDERSDIGDDNMSDLVRRPLQIFNSFRQLLGGRPCCWSLAIRWAVSLQRNARRDANSRMTSSSPLV